MPRKSIAIGQIPFLIFLYQFWDNHKGTPLDFIQKMQQNRISLGKIDIYVIFIKRDVALWNWIFCFFKKTMEINGPVVGYAVGGGFWVNFLLPIRKNVSACSDVFAAG